MTDHTSVVRGDALALPVADASVDLIVTSPPYFALRSYQDGGEHYEGQVGSEPTPQAFLEALWAVTKECWRVLKPTGSLFVNLGDKYAGSGGHNNAGVGGSGRGPASYNKSTAVGLGPDEEFRTGARDGHRRSRNRAVPGVRPKSLMGLPWRYAIGCIDGEADPGGVGWILRAEMVWSKPNGLPESATDRVRRSHEQWFHLTRSGVYYSAVDELRVPHAVAPHSPGQRNITPDRNDGDRNDRVFGDASLGKLPSSVWTIPTEPLMVPEHVGVDHFAAFPTEWPRRLILGWSPRDVCVACGEGRRPYWRKVGLSTYEQMGRTRGSDFGLNDSEPGNVGNTRDENGRVPTFVAAERRYAGEVCACTPDRPRADGGREYIVEWWTPPPTRPGVVLDPFGGTGTTAMVANALGRTGISVDLSADYCRLAQWRINHSDHDLKAVARTEGDVMAESLRARREAERAGQGTLL